MKILTIITITSCFFYAVASSNYCNTLHLDYVRRQLENFNSTTPFTEEDGTKHTPYIKVDNGVATVTVGNGNVEGGIYHPMIPSGDPNQVHWVTHIYVVDQNDHVIQMKTMDPTSAVPATFSFDVPEGVTQLIAYEFCNLHGLWKGPTLLIETSLRRLATTVDDTCQKDDVPPNAYESWSADFNRRQEMPPFDLAHPYTTDGKHAPYITLDGSKGRIVVGTEENMHVMIGGDAETPPHWITDIYVLDQDKKIIAFQALDPTNVDIATMEFDVPESATDVTAYEWCNIHGLWKGPTVEVNIEEQSLKSDARSTFYHKWVYVGCLLSILSILSA